MIDLKDIEFSYRSKGKPALQGITTRLEPGIHLLAGENGAGKTTLLHLLAGVARPTHGQITIDGIDPTSTNPKEMGRTFLLEEAQYFPGKSIRRFAQMHSRFYPGFSAENFIANLAAFGLTGDEAMEKLSLGNRKKAQLAYVLALGVDVLLLDEPTNALDIEGRNTLRKLIGRSVRDDQTVIISTHAVTELENLYDGALMLSRSQLIYSGTADEVSSRLSFIVSRIPDKEALYSEIQVGRVLNIVPTSEEGEPTSVDWRLLYSSLHSSQRALILDYLTTMPENKHEHGISE